MKRFTALTLVLILCFSLAGCKSGSKTPEVMSAEEVPVLGSDMNGNDGGRIFSQQVLELPESGVGILHAAKAGDSIFMAGRDSSNNFHFFRMDIESRQICPVSGLDIQGLVDIDGREDGTAVILSLDKNGGELLTLVSPDGTIRRIEAEAPQNAEGLFPFSVSALENGFLIQDLDSVFALDEDGDLLQILGPYTGAIYMVSKSDGFIIANSGDYGSVGLNVDIYGMDLKRISRFRLESDYLFLFKGTENYVYSSLSNIIYRLDLETGERQGYVNCLASGGGFNDFIYLSEDCFFSVQNARPCLWSPRPMGEVQVIKLATYSTFNPKLNLAVSLFNEKNTGYFIDLVNYSAYDSSASPMLGIGQLHTDIVSGNAPDIIDLEGLPAMSYTASGILQDLRPFFDADPELDYDDLYESAAKSLEYKGGLYELVPAFGVSCFCGSSRYVGADSHWTSEELLALSKEYSAVEIFGCDMTQSDFLRCMLEYTRRDYIDLEKAVCDFDNPRFISLLEFAAGLPASYDSNSSESSSQPWGRAFNGRQLVLSSYLTGRAFDDISINSSIFKDELQYVGFPSETGNGIALVPTMRFGMSSSANSPDGVWEFFKFLLSDEYQHSSPFPEVDPSIFMIDDFPILKPNLESHMDAELDSLIKYEEAHPNCCLFTWDQDQAEIKIPYAPLSVRHKDLLLSLFEKADCYICFDDEIYDIIVRDAQPYFAGDKTAQEAARLIQSKMSIYLSEQFA